MTYFYLLLGSLAVFRLSVLFADDAGPYGMFRRLRGWLKREAKESPKLRKSEVAHGVECRRCNSVWFGTLIAAYVVSEWRSIWIDGFLLMLALSGAAILWSRAFPAR